MTTFTTPPDAPSRNDPPATFISKANAFLAWLVAFALELIDFVASLTLISTTGASATSNSIGTGAKTFTADTGKSWSPGMFIVIADTAAPSTNSMIAQITSYNSGTGALVVDVKSTLGSGTKTAWTISQTANPVPLDGSVATSSIQDDAVTFAKVQNVATSRILGRTTASSGSVEELTVGNGLSLSSGSLSFATGTVLQELTATDAGSSTTATTMANVSASVKNITPKSNSSTIIIEVSFQGRSAYINGSASWAEFQLYDSTNTTLIGESYRLSATNTSFAPAANSTGMYTPCIVRVAIANTVTTQRSFTLRALTSSASAAAEVSKMVWTIREVQG